jgi:hypothetical protein
MVFVWYCLQCHINSPIDTAFWVRDYIILNDQLLFGSIIIFLLLLIINSLLLLLKFFKIVHLLENFVNQTSLGKWEGATNDVGEYCLLKDIRSLVFCEIKFSVFLLFKKNRIVKVGLIMLIFFFGTETKWALNNQVAFLNTFIYPLLKLVLIFGNLSY